MDVIWKGAADQPLLALTIDDFPASGAGQTCSGTMALLDQLQRLAHPGAILVLHDGSQAGAATRRSLGVVVPALQRRGFRFVTLSGLLACGRARRRIAGRRQGLSP